MFRPQGHTVITKGSKTCSRCSNSYPKTTKHWYRSPKRSDGCTGHCKYCQLIHKKKKYPSIRGQRADYMRLSKYGITQDQYKEMLANAQFKCEICKRPFSYDRKSTSPAIDHDHATGKVRGVLCSFCNRALGLLLDNEETCEAAAAYLKSRKK